MRLTELHVKVLRVAGARGVFIGAQLLRILLMARRSVYLVEQFIAVFVVRASGKRRLSFAYQQPLALALPRPLLTMR